MAKKQKYDLTIPDMGAGKYRTKTGKVVDRNEIWRPPLKAAPIPKKKPTKGNGTAKKVGGVSRPKGMY